MCFPSPHPITEYSLLRSKLCIFPKHHTSKMDFLELNQEMIDGNPVPALCTSNAGPSAVLVVNDLTGKEMGFETGKEQKTNVSALHGSISVCPLVA